MAIDDVAQKRHVPVVGALDGESMAFGGLHR